MNLPYQMLLSGILALHAKSDVRSRPSHEPALPPVTPVKKARRCIKMFSKTKKTEEALHKKKNFHNYHLRPATTIFKFLELILPVHITTM